MQLKKVKIAILIHVICNGPAGLIVVLLADEGQDKGSPYALKIQDLD